MCKLYYFQAPTFEINPKSQVAPRLGSIFSKLDHLASPLSQDEHIAVPERLVNESANSNFSDTQTRSLQADVELTASIAQGIAGSGELIYAFAREKEDLYQCEHLATTELAPDETYVPDSILASQRVQSFLEDSPFGRKRAYMITGLKIASGFSKSTLRRSSHGPSLKTAAGAAAAFGAPVEAGPQIGVAVESGRTLEHGRASNDIIFAYRVVRIRVRRDGEVAFKYKSGGKYAADDDSDDSDDDGGHDWLAEPLDEDDLEEEFPDLVKVTVEYYAP